MSKNNLYTKNTFQYMVYEKSHKVEPKRWVVMKFKKWSSIQLGPEHTLPDQLDGSPHACGFLPVFDNYEAALDYSDNRSELVLEIQHKNQ